MKRRGIVYRSVGVGSADSGVLWADGVCWRALDFFIWRYPTRTNPIATPIMYIATRSMNFLSIFTTDRSGASYAVTLDVGLLSIWFESSDGLP